VFISQLRVRFLLDLSADYPSFSKECFSRNCGLFTSYGLKLWITHLLLVSYFTLFIMSTSMEEVLIVLRNLEHENQAFGEYVVICKPIKLQFPWDVFQQHNPNQRNHILTYLTSLMAHIQIFKVLSTKCVWSLTSSYGICIKVQTIVLRYFMGWNNAHKSVPAWITNWCERLITHLARPFNIKLGHCTSCVVW